MKSVLRTLTLSLMLASPMLAKEEAVSVRITADPPDARVIQLKQGPLHAND